jgi:hypothetical protein
MGAEILAVFFADGTQIARQCSLNLGLRSIRKNLRASLDILHVLRKLHLLGHNKTCLQDGNSQLDSSMENQGILPAF